MHTPGQARSWRVPDLAVSFIRTWVPVGVAGALTWAARRWGIVLPAELSAEATGWVVVGVTVMYHALARWLERRTGYDVSDRAARWLGRWMLGGVVRQPAYVAPGQRLVVVGEDGSMRAAR